MALTTSVQELFWVKIIQKIILAQFEKVPFSDENWLVCPASCVVPPPESGLEVEVVSVEAADLEMRLPAEVTPHEDFETDRHRNIAMVRVDRIFEFSGSQIQPLKYLAKSLLFVFVFFKMSSKLLMLLHNHPRFWT